MGQAQHNPACSRHRSWQPHQNIALCVSSVAQTRTRLWHHDFKVSVDEFKAEGARTLSCHAAGQVGSGLNFPRWSTEMSL